MKLVKRRHEDNRGNFELDGSTHPCSIEQTGGGVGRNMAEALWRMGGGGVRLLTAVGNDSDGQYLQDIVPGLILDGCTIKGEKTATYAAVLDSKGECLMGLGNMGIHDHITVDLLNKHAELLEQAPMIIFDGNIPQRTMEHVLQICDKMQKPVFFEPTDQRKAIKPLIGKLGPTFATPNLSELHAMASFINCGININTSTSNSIVEVLELCKIVSQTIKFLIVTMGSKGVLTFHNCRKSNLDVRLYSVEPAGTIVSVSGAGDCFASGFISGMLAGQPQSSCVQLGFEAAKCALSTHSTVPTHFYRKSRKAQYTRIDVESL